MGHSSSRAALIYQHATDSSIKQLAENVAKAPGVVRTREEVLAGPRTREGGKGRTESAPLPLLWKAARFMQHEGLIELMGTGGDTMRGNFTTDYQRLDDTANEYFNAYVEHSIAIRARMEPGLNGFGLILLTDDGTTWFRHL